MGKTDPHIHTARGDSVADLPGGRDNSMSEAWPNRRKVVITGMGAISPLGLTVDELWQGLVEGRSGIDFVSIGDPKDYPVKIDGEVKGSRASRAAPASFSMSPLSPANSVRVSTMSKAAPTS